MRIAKLMAAVLPAGVMLVAGLASVVVPSSNSVSVSGRLSSEAAANGTGVSAMGTNKTLVKTLRLAPHPLALRAVRAHSMPSAPELPETAPPPSAVPNASRPASVPAGESEVSDPYASSAPVRYCPDNDLYAQWDPTCDEVESWGQPTSVPNGGFVIMRCWIGNGGDFPQYGWFSQKWFYVTVATGNPETQVSGFMYSMVVADQVSTPECGSAQFDDYPYDPHSGYVTITNEPSAGQLTIDFSSIAFGPATLYCHVGSASDYQTGGTVTDLGIFDIDSSNYWVGLTISACGTGNQWIGIITSDGIIRYSNEITTGSSSPPPAPSPPPTEPYNDYLEGTSSPYGIIASPNYYVGANIAIDGLTVLNYGSTPVTVDEIALGVTSPDGQRTEYQCTDSDTGAALVNVTIEPSQVIGCDASFSPDAVGTWTYNLDWQGSDGQWRYDYLYAPMTMQIVPLPSPANDDFANAQNITDTNAFIGDNTYATAQPGEPDHGPGVPAQQSVWYKFTASMTGRAYVAASDIDGNGVAIAAYTGNAVSDLTWLAYWDGTSPDEIAFAVSKGETYYIAIDNYADYPVSGAPFTGRYTIAPSSPPPNSSFRHAQRLRSGGRYDMNLTNATVQAGEPRIIPGMRNSGTLWYVYRPARNVILTLKSAGGNTNVYYGFFRCLKLRSLRRVDHGSMISSHSSFTPTEYLTAGRTYYLAFENLIPSDPLSGMPAPGQFDFSARVKPLRRSA